MGSDSDVDFHDVFGGPPRRSSIHEAARYSFNEFKDSYSLRGKEKSTVYRSSWSGLSEKPVFGDEISDRRRYTTDDFFNDIFRGGESPSLTPRKSDQDPCSSSPGSRVLSPVRPLPPRAEPFGSQSLPAHFSLPAKLTKGMDLMPFASVTRNPYGNKGVTANVISSPNSPSTSMSRFSNQTIQGQDELRNDVRSSYRQSPLSHEFSLSRVGSVKETKFDKAEVGGNLKRDSNSCDVTSNGTQFHFSIYKWASKGVPLTLPLRGGSTPKLKEKTTEICSISSKGKVEDESMVSESLAETLSDVEFPSLDDSASTNTLSYRMERKKQDNESLLNKTTREKIESCQTVEDTVIAIPQSEPLVNLQNIVGDVTGEIILHDTREEKKHNALPDVGLRGKTKEEFHLLTREACKPELESLPGLIYDNNNEQGENVMKQEGSGRKESMVKSTKKSSGNIKNIGRSGKTQDGKRSNPNGADMDKDSVQHSALKSGVNIGRNKVKGKVKEFVKMFNQEAPLKPINYVDTQSLSYKWRAGATCRAENEVSVARDSKDENLNIPNVKKKKKTPSNSSVKGDEYLKQLERQNSVIETTALIFSDNSPGQTDSLLRSSVSVRASNATLGNLDDSFQGSFLVKELSQEQNKLPQTGEDHEGLQVSDAKIRKWSNGKEGNIRSLLSTLQYILWAESGWKPVPLVDIIEGNAVKKAYQKALLCLHPDKLQQKGVAAHEKYIAEKVFDILQDAWTHFNSLASL